MADERLDRLREAREVMWESMKAADPEKRAPLMAQWRALDASIAELEGARKAGGPGDPADEIAARRAARGGSAARSRRAGAGQG